jgi:hypothetical protein
MTTPVLPSTLDFNYVLAARRRVEDMRSRAATSLEPPTLSELEEVLGERLQKVKLMAQNWRNRIYRIELANGDLVLAKQVVVATAEMFEYQYKELQALSNLQIAGLRVPKPCGVMPAKRVYLMGFAPGKPIPDLVEGPRSKDLPGACQLAGKILARLQVNWTRQIYPMPVAALDRDFAAAPWRLSPNEQRTLRTAFACLQDAHIIVGPVYYDYKAANLLSEKGELSLVDPPDTERQGAHLWDFSCFRSSMRRHLWRFRLRRPLDRRARLIKEGLIAFEQSYLANLTQRHPQPLLFAVATRLFELQRTAVLMTMQLGKIEITAREATASARAELGGLIANRMTLPLLRMEKRWLFRQLARELP